MVKNTTGGNRAKSFASKLTTNMSNHRTIVSLNDSEIYVCVTKLLGNGRFMTIDNSGKEYLAILRNKMKGRNKRNYLVSMFSLLLVTLQGFSTESNDVEIMAVYNDIDIHFLSKKHDIDINYLINCHNNNTIVVAVDHTKSIINTDRYDFDSNYYGEDDNNKKEVKEIKDGPTKIGGDTNISILGMTPKWSNDTDKNNNNNNNNNDNNDIDFDFI